MQLKEEELKEIASNIEGSSLTDSAQIRDCQEDYQRQPLDYSIDNEGKLKPKRNKFSYDRSNKHSKSNPFEQFSKSSMVEQ